MLRGGRVAVLDAPWLYSYVFHGANTFKAAHWEQHWQEASATFRRVHCTKVHCGGCKNG